MHSRLFLLAASLAAVACARPASHPPAPVGEPLPVPQLVIPDVVLAGATASDSPDRAAVSPADLGRQATALLGAEAAPADTAAPVPEAAVTPAPGPSWDIDVRSYEAVARVRHYVEQFTGKSRQRIADRLSEGTRYEGMIRARLREGGVPEDMYYLALVESGFDPHAYSRAAAVGMWQFMTTTARGMGLRVDWWVDERRDPVRSTEAAVRFLRGLNEQFGSMYLAAAAYNGGPGRVARGLSRYEEQLDGMEGDDLFFALADRNYLRNETRDYVPQLIAAALVAKEADRHGLTIEQRPAFEYDSVRVGPLTALPAVASASGTPVREIVRLNPHLLRGMTPPKVASVVRIPLGSRPAFDSAFAALPSEAKAGARVIVTRKAATWATLARAEGLSAKSLSGFNPKTRASRKTGLVAAGTQLLVPTASAAAAALAVPDPSVERYGRGARTHVVRKGENLSVIAKRYRTTTAQLMKLNRLRKPLIFAGQELRIR